jgi:hypothetical protein
MVRMERARRRGGRGRCLVALTLVVVALATGPNGTAQAAKAVPTATPAPQAVDCTATAMLVNPCRPWLGAVADNYPVAGTWKDQILAHEQRIGRTVDVVHGYHPAGSVTLLSDERFFVNRGTILYLNWRPANVWRDATGTKATVTTQIDKMATQLASVAPRKVMLSLFGEAERFVTPGTSACPGLHGASGSPADYLAMWAFVQARFAALGVTNIVWVMNYLGYDGWDCLFPEMWPGNDRVDWVTWDPYVGPRERWDEEAGYFYRALERETDAAHAFTSKPWGLAEFGYWYGPNQAEAYRMYDDARAWLSSGLYPRIKLYEPFDMISAGVDTRTSYTTAGVFDPTEQARYNAFANDPAFTDPVGPPPPPPPPTPSDHLAGCDPGVETGISCFNGIYSGAVPPRLQTADGHTGTNSVEVYNPTTANGTFGLNVRPAPVGSTVIGRTYTGSVWVKANRVGMPITFLLRERRPSNGTAPVNGYTSVTWTATDTLWHQMNATYVGKEAANTVTFSVYASPMTGTDLLRADDFVLTSLP